MAIQGGPTYRLSEQPWAQPGEICLGETPPVSRCNSSKLAQQMLKGMSMFCFFSFFFFFSSPSLPPSFPASLLCPLLAKINEIVMATYRVMKSKLPSTLQSMSLYLANRDTEFILFKPVRVGFFSVSPFCCTFSRNLSLCESLLNNTAQRQGAATLCEFTRRPCS